MAHKTIQGIGEEGSLMGVFNSQALCCFSYFETSCQTLVMWHLWFWPFTIRSSSLVWSGLLSFLTSEELCLALLAIGFNYPEGLVLKKGGMLQPLCYCVKKKKYFGRRLDEPHIQMDQSEFLTTAEGFLSVCGVRFAMCHQPMAARDVPQCLAELWPKPVGTKAKTCCQLRKAFSDFFFGSFNAKTPFISDKNRSYCRIQTRLFSSSSARSRFPFFFFFLAFFWGFKGPLAAVVSYFITTKGRLIDDGIRCDPKTD